MENTEIMNLEEGDHAQEDQSDSSRPYNFSVMPYSIDPFLEFIDFSKEGHLFMGSSNLVGQVLTGSVWFFESGDVKPLETESLSAHGCETCVADGKFLDNWEKVIIGEDSGKISIFSITKFEDNSTHFLPLHSATQHESFLTSMTLVQDKQLSVTTGSDMRINVWDNSNLEIQHKYWPAHFMEISCVCSSPDEAGVIFASSSLDGSSLLWDLRQPKPASVLVRNELGLTSVAWKDDNTVVVGTIGGNVVYYDIRNKSDIKRLSFDKHAVHKISINIEQELMAVCGNTHIIKVWDFNTYELVYIDSEHTKLVRDLAWNPVNFKLYSCGFDKRIISHIVPSSAEKEEMFLLNNN